MADQKLSSMTADTNPGSDSLVYTVDDPAGTEANRKVTLANLYKGIIGSGWVDAGESWSYSAWDDTNGVSTATITVPTDATTKYQAGMRVKFDQTTDGTKYGIITKVAATALTVFLNTDYDFDNETISNPYFSYFKAPFGFDLDPKKYTVETTDSTDLTQAPATASTWYNIGSISIDIPVGANLWDVYYEVNLQSDRSTSNAVEAFVTLSTANNSVSDVKYTCYTQLSSPTSGAHEIHTTMFRRIVLGGASKATRYLNAKHNFGTGTVNLGYIGTFSPTIVRAVLNVL